MRAGRGVASLLLAASCVGPVVAQDLAVRAGRLLDVERGELLADRLVRVTDGRIVAVEPWPGRAPEGLSLVDWSCCTVLPGLIDLHTHLIGEIQSANIAAPLQSSEAADALAGAAHAGATLRAGFTTVRDVGCYRAFTDVALREAIDAGRVEGPRMLVAGAYLTVSGGGGEVTGFAPDVRVPEAMRRGVADDEAAVRRVVRELVAGGADVVKVIATGAVLTAGTTPAAPEYTEAELRAAVEQASALGVHVAAHAHGAEGIKRAVRAGVRTIEHASYLDEEAIALMVKHGTWLVADVYNGDYIAEVGAREGWPAEILRKNAETTETQRRGFAAAVRAGVRIGFGTDAGVFPHGENARQFAYMVRLGMSPLAAIRAATIDAARLLGRERELGAIAPGRHADLIAVAGDPLADVERLRAVRGVIKGGVPVALRDAGSAP